MLGKKISISSSDASTNYLSVSSSKPKSIEELYPYLIQNENPEDRWEMLNEIGDGAFSKVFRVKNRQSGLIAAAKIITKCEHNEISQHIVEVEILRNAKHKNIIEFYEAYFFKKSLWVSLVPIFLSLTKTKKINSLHPNIFHKFKKITFFL